jgi:alkylation response protein AidB-like acyl-CoA dehydrogenase
MSNEHESMHGDLAQGVGMYAERSRALVRLRALRDDPLGFDAPGWAQAGALGWLGVRVPERMGGSGLGLAEAAVLMRAAGRALLPEPLIAGGLLAARLLQASEAPAARDILERMLRGEGFVGTAWQETLGDIDPGRVTTVLRSGRLTGSKSFVVFGGAAAGWLVSARDAAGVGVCWVEAGAPGVTYVPIRRADGSEHGALRLDDVAVPARHLLISHEAGEAVLAAAVDEAIVALSAELLGIGERALEITLEHLRTRVQFGTPIGSFQALQHRCVDLFVRKELGAAALDAVLAQWERANGPRRSALASRVKARCADAAMDICRQAVQMHGAMGFTDECDVGLYLKRALVDVAWLGNAQVHRRRYARLALGVAGTDSVAEAA